MKKLRLRGWVKSLLVVIITLTAIAWLNADTNRAIRSCTENGHTQTFCENSLR